MLMGLGLLKSALLSSGAVVATGLNTPLKRRTAAGVPFLPLGPSVTPDVNKDAAWRRQVAWGYLQLVSGGDGNTFNVLDYGAVGDGIADDTPAIRAALAAASASSSQTVTVYFPNGTYNVCRQAGDPAWPTFPVIFSVSTSGKNITFNGQSRAGVTIRGFMPGLADPETNWTNTGDPYFKIARFCMFNVGGTGRSNITFQVKNMVLDGNAAYTGDHSVGGNTTTGDGWDLTHKGIQVANGSNLALILENCQIANWRGENVWGGNHNLTVTGLNASFTGSNGSALSVSQCVMTDCTFGASGADTVYNGVENYSFDGETSEFYNCTFGSKAANCLVYIGQDGGALTVDNCDFNATGNHILLSDGAWNVDITNNTFAGGANGVIVSVVGGGQDFFANHNISGNSFNGSGALYLNQGQSIPGLSFVNNTITAGSLLAGNFASSTNFTATGTILNGGRDVSSYGGAPALWTNTTRLTSPEFQSSGVQINDFTGGATRNISSFSDLVALNDNTTTGPLALTVANASAIPEGQIITFKRYGSDTNWVLDANPAWNDFAADVPINGEPVVLIKQGGVLSQYAINNGDSFLLAANAINTDQSYTDGMYWLRAYDMANDFGAAGAALAAANKRYVWLCSSDHYGGSWAWAGGIWAGWSDDPAVVPDKFSMILHQDQGATMPDVSGSFVQLETPWLVWNPDTSLFHLYAHGNCISDGARGQETALFTSPDFVTWTQRGISHITAGNGGHTGYQTAYRTGVDTWEGWGLVTPTLNLGHLGRWTSTDGGLNFTIASTLTRTIGTRSFNILEGHPYTTIGGRRYSFARDDDRTAGNGMRATLVPIQTDGDIDTADVNDLILVTPEYDGVYPGLGYVQQVSGHEEDGVYFGTVVKGFYSDTGLAPEDVTNYQEIDLWAIITDATAAAGAAPVGLRASCAAGVITVSWYDILPQGTYRIDTSASSSGPWTDHGDFVGGSAPINLGDLDALRYVRLTKLTAGVDQQSRIVPIWVSAASATANQHITRVATSGGDTSTVDPVWLDAAITWLSSNGLTGNLAQWTDPRFGVNTTGNLICYDLAATINSRQRGDFQALTSGITRSANTFGTGKAGLVAAATTDRWTWSAPNHMMNNIRRFDGLTIAVAYSRTNAFKTTFFTSGGDSDWCDFSHDNGSNSGVTFHFQRNSPAPSQNLNVVCDIVTETANQVAIGVLTGSGTAKVRAGGNWGTEVTGITVSGILTGDIGDSKANINAMGGGTVTQKYAIATGYSHSSANSQCEIMSIVIFNVALSDSLAVSLETLLDGEMA